VNIKALMRSAASREAFFQGGDEAAFGLAVEIVEDFRHLLMGVALGGARQVGHEFHPQRLFDLVENVLLHAFHAQHALHHFQGKLFGQGAKTRGRHVPA
jgi:DNA-binding GntR family transcriptional regulator